MFNFRYIKSEPTTYLMQFKQGQLKREGAGLSFFYFAPTTTLVAVPVGSTDLPFIFTEVTQDFQEVTVQGQVIYRIRDPKRVASLINFTLGENGKGYATKDPEKVQGRLLGLVQVITRSQLQTLGLRDALMASEGLVRTLREGLSDSEVLAALGIEVLDVVVLAIKPTPDTARALESTVREQMLKSADQAIYDRRNSAVEQERAIKENELRTELAVEAKKREIREAQIEAERAVLNKKRTIAQEQLAGKIDDEGKRRELVALSTDNSRKEADAKAYGISAMMNAMAGVDSRILEALTSSGMAPEQLIAQAFKQLAGGAEKIGQLNISPDLLRELMGTGD